MERPPRPTPYRSDGLLTMAQLMNYDRAMYEWRTAEKLCPGCADEPDVVVNPENRDNAFRYCDACDKARRERIARAE